ncbi:MAG: RIP metalloprotease RseP [Candidatus Moranbacteria bacterium]|nr:RIP metalloprotease RseP [Candidatus Moranbacteria bacterium]
MLLTAVVFILMLGILVLVHEAGHFLVAKRNGVGAEEFGFGFPPRIVGFYQDENNKRRIIWGNKEVDQIKRKADATVYSINLIPIGGFVKITGEDGSNKDNPKSFASQGVWTRFKILFAGVGMNFILGILLLAFAFQLGLPEAVDDSVLDDQAKVQIGQVVKNSPAENLGIEMGDELFSVVAGEKEEKINSTEQFQNIIAQNAGKEIILNIKRPGQEEIIEKKVVIRETAPEGEGLLGVVLVKTIFKQYGFFESFWLAVKTEFAIIIAILSFIGDFFVKLFTNQPTQADVTGPVGIAILTGQVARLGLAYVLQFAAMLSINLAIINLLPLPALDGGRILFLGVEKIKGSPVSQKVEGIVHTAGFVFLITLMLFITVKDFINFEIWSKLINIF